jgi:HPt (histidine-containing phosphotransfer) domain-containing protein
MTATPATAARYDAGLPPPAAMPVFDERVLGDMFRDDPQMMGTVLQTFCASMLSTVAMLAEVLKGEDLMAVVSTAHRIKGAARISGALAMAEQAMLLEGQARQGDWAQSRALGASLAEQWRLFQGQARVNQLLAQAPSAPPDTLS